MLSFEAVAPYANAPQLAVAWRGDDGKPTGVRVNLPVLPTRFFSPWPLGKDDFFRLWKQPQNETFRETQAKFTFAAPHDMGEIKRLLSDKFHLAVLEGVDPQPNNACAAAAFSCKGGAVPPAPGAHYCLMRLEIIPDYSTAPDGTKRAASRLTARGSHIGITDALNQSLTAQFS
jgi:hypothetical protein